MRLIKKRLAALGSLFILVTHGRNAIANQWLPVLTIVMGLFIASEPLVAATEPDTVLTNKVVVNYTVGNGAPIRTESSVSLTTSPRTPAKIAFYSQFDGGNTLNVQPTLFSSSASSNAWQPVISSVQGNTELIQTISFSPGEQLVIRVEDFDQNIDSASQEKIIVDLRIGNTGDVERLQLTETSLSSGVFVGVVPLVGVSQVLSNNGKLSVEALSEISAKYVDQGDSTDTVAAVGIVDPSNLVFDSTTGKPINGATITIVAINSQGSQGARVYDQHNGDWPSTVVSGAPVFSSDSARSAPMGEGEFQFPRVLGGQYELRVTPPVGYRYPSEQSQTQLQLLGDIASQVTTGSRGEVFSILDALGTVRLNIPLDRFNGRFSVQKKVDQTSASVGDVLTYTITAKNNDSLHPLPNSILKDTLPPGFRYQLGSAKNSAGLPFSGQISVDGRSLEFSIGNLLANTTQEISYRVVVGAGSADDVAVNAVQGFSNAVASNIATASVDILDELMRTKNILIGRVYSGDCEDKKRQQPVKNARLYLDNGRTVLTDSYGRWHLEGVSPGTHAIQLDETSLPNGMVASPCKLTAAHVKQPHSRVLNLRRGHIWQTNFHIAQAKEGQKEAKQQAIIRLPEYQLPNNPLTLYGADYVATAKPGLEIVWPPNRHTPAISSLNIAVKYPPKNRLKLLLNGETVNPVNLEGSNSNRAKTVAIKRWKGVDITQKRNTLTAILQDKSGKEIKRIERYVHFTESSIRAKLVPSASVLLADGINQPVIAIRLEDEEGYTPRPRTHGYYTLDQNHWKVASTNSEKSSSVALSKSTNGKYEYTVSDDGLVRVRLEPTARSGHITVNVALADGKKGSVKAWLEPTLRDWIMVGFVNGTLGHKHLSGNMQTLGDLKHKQGVYKTAEASFFAKGRIKGKYLLTIAYDSNKKTGEVGEQLNGVIDPSAWYTLYGDEQQHEQETPSSSKLYLKLEREKFYALFGDFATDLDVTELGSYARVLHGLKSSYEGEKVHYTAFASKTNSRYQRDEIQGDGTSGLYSMSRLPVGQSETVILETRDRNDLSRVLSSRSLSRYSDYDIDYDAKTIFFKFPISGTDDKFNPIFIVIDYESEDVGGDKVFAVGGRIGIKRMDDRLHAGTTYLRDNKDQLFAIDAKFDVTDQLKLKAEVAHSKAALDATAWVAAAEYRDEKWQARLFARQQETGFGLGQHSTLAEGERNLGITATYKLTNDQAFIGSVSQLDKLANDNNRRTQSLEWQKNDKGAQFSVGYHHLKEEVDGKEKSSQSIRIGGSKAFPDINVSLLGQLEKALNNSGTEQNPDRLSVGLDYKLSEKVSLFAKQEYTSNDFERHSNTRIGMKSRLWEGGNIHTDLVHKNKNDSARNYAVIGMSQHWQVDEHLHLDLNVDKAQTINKLSYTPLSTSSTNTINADDYLSVSLGAGWNNKAWSAAARAEYRDGQASKRHSLQYNLVRKLDDQYAVSQQARVLDTQYANGDSKRQAKFGFSLALRGKEYDYTMLNQLDYLHDTSEVASVKSKTSKFINNLHYNRDLNEKLELSIHQGTKLTQLGSDSSDWGVTDTLQLGARFDINQSWDVGAQAGYLHHWDTNTMSGFAGLSLGFTPAKNMRVEVGYNFDGFRDDDFSGQNHTHEGPYVSLNYLLDQSLFKAFERAE